MPVRQTSSFVGESWPRVRLQVLQNSESWPWMFILKFKILSLARFEENIVESAATYKLIQARVPCCASPLTESCHAAEQDLSRS